MNYEIAELFKLDMHEVGCLDKLLLSGGSTGKPEHNVSYFQLIRSTAEYISTYKDSTREITVEVKFLQNDITSVSLIEKISPLKSEKPKKPTSIFSTIYHRGRKLFVLDEEALASSQLVERRGIVYVASAEGSEEFLDLANEAVELLLQQYFTVYGEPISGVAFHEWTLEDMVITHLLRKHDRAPKMP